MKWLLLLFVTSPVISATRTIVDKIEKLEWDGENYILDLNSFQKEIKISGDSPTVPCLENARLAKMSVLLKIDPRVPFIESCKLYSDSLPPASPLIEAQAQEESPSPKKILKR